MGVDANCSVTRSESLESRVTALTHSSVGLRSALEKIRRAVWPWNVTASGNRNWGESDCSFSQSGNSNRSEGKNRTTFSPKSF